MAPAGTTLAQIRRYASIRGHTSRPYRYQQPLVPVNNRQYLCENTDGERAPKCIQRGTQIH